MKIRITHMKAPWPEGTKVGDVLAVRAIPAWAAGKCVQVADDEKAVAEYVPADPVEAEPQRGDLVKQLNEATALLTAREETLADLRAGVLEFDAKLAAAEKAATDAKAESEDLRAKLAAAEKALAEHQSKAKPGKG